MNAIVEGKIGSVDVKFEATGCAECVQDTIAAFHEFRRGFEKSLKEAKLADRPKEARPCGCGNQSASDEP